MKKSERRRRHRELLRAIESHIEKKKGTLTAEQERKLEAALTRKSEPDFGTFFDLVLGVYRRRVEELRDEMGIQDRHDAMIAEGNVVRDIDFTDHGRPETHTNPHQHVRIPNETGGTPKRGPAEPLKQKQQ